MTAFAKRFIYFVKPVGQAGPIKIGCSDNPESRLLSLMTWSPYPLEIVHTIPGNFDLENNLHDCFATAHLHREWFHPTPELVAAIDAMKAGASVEKAVDLSNRFFSLRAKRYRERRKRSWSATWHFSYTVRLRAAEKRGEKARGEPVWLPRDVDEAMSRWNWQYEPATKEYVDGIPPTAEEMRRIEEVIADPARHCLTRLEKYPNWKVA